MGHSKDVLQKSKFLSVRFNVTAKCRKMSLRLWEGGRLLDLDVLQYNRDALAVESQLVLMAQFLEAVSWVLGIISCGGFSVIVIKTLQRCPMSKVRVHCLYDMKAFNLEIY